jgi:hypothetical protein
MQRVSIGVVGAMIAGLVSIGGASFAGTTSWTETTATGISLSGSQATESAGNGTDTLFAQAAGGASSSSFSASSSASATFNYIVTWTPQVQGEQPPKFGIITFNRWGEDYVNVSGGCAPSGSANASGSGQSTSATGAFASFNICCGQSANQTSGSMTLVQLPGTFSVKGTLVHVGNVWTVTIPVGASASGSVSGSSTNGGSGGTGIGQFKQVTIGASVSN